MYLFRRKFLLAAVLATLSFSAAGQSAIVRGEASAGVYENISSTSQRLNVNAAVTSGTASVGVTFTHTAAATLVTSTSLVGANASRKYLQIQNQDAANPIWVNCAGSAAVADGTAVKLAANQTWAPAIAPVGACAGIATGGTVVTSIVSGQ
jgi:hypothetical protein